MIADDSAKQLNIAININDVIKFCVIVLVTVNTKTPLLLRI